MNFDYSDTSIALQEKLKEFMEIHVLPIEKEVELFHKNPENSWKRWPGLESLKQKAKDAGLRNVFLPGSYGALSAGLSNLEYAPLAEIMGRVLWSSEIFNCNAPDTGNMEVLAKYGTP
ncbi:acyl-CoA dehydrogenase family protein [Lacinutrix neustonica]|uniref:Acyl-CoA dehydrogenase family protein n=1 Tax=Lacinutrix neustonica TaxID=2980107 RepID=A0A9E8MX02_9FLAO|nr:acyl-CoA dehydrogenase family protein [Lacinutrix neustonica]WAC03098.1 acyl-CoA dehydrogenase family protein [Lacinutrix neustonica]